MNYSHFEMNYSHFELNYSHFELEKVYMCQEKKGEEDLLAFQVASIHIYDDS